MVLPTGFKEHNGWFHACAYARHWWPFQLTVHRFVNHKLCSCRIDGVISIRIRVWGLFAHDCSSRTVRTTDSLSRGLFVQRKFNDQPIMLEASNDETSGHITLCQHSINNRIVIGLFNLITETKNQRSKLAPLCNLSFLVQSS